MGDVRRGVALRSLERSRLKTARASASIKTILAAFPPAVSILER